MAQTVSHWLAIEWLIKDITLMCVHILTLDHADHLQTLLVIKGLRPVGLDVDSTF